MSKKFCSVKILKSKPIYNKHGITILEDSVKFADGTTYEYVYFRSKGTVVIAAFTEDKKMILTKQYRHPLRRIVYDVPGGAIENGETPLEAALRELEEETGFTAEKLEWIGRFSRGPSSQAVVEVFFAKIKRKNEHFDTTEIVEIEMVDFDSLFKRILKGECFDAAVVISVLLVSAKRLLE
ncbi:MAG: NUDIX hydrolase [Candidatus Bathyarchaeota archaeon]|nr:NUDIX hydrolase [Candidatus Bathyarchaeota archaeon A05DMB-5]MDH7557577.1 NUDIX hydrolase [Candidatus Bathyarchaeota archaeon]